MILTVTGPEGDVRDESGRYAVEGGRATVPIRFAKGDPEGSLFKPWRITVRDLTSGLEETEKFRHAK